jgi:hypothetical protein
MYPGSDRMDIRITFFPGIDFLKKSRMMEKDENISMRTGLCLSPTIPVIPDECIAANGTMTGDHIPLAGLHRNRDLLGICWLKNHRTGNPFFPTATGWLFPYPMVTSATVHDHLNCVLVVCEVVV